MSAFLAENMKMILCFLVGGASLCYGLFRFARTLWLRRRCQMRVNATICAFTDKLRKQGKHYKTWYRPTYQYCVNAQKYKVNSVAQYTIEKRPELGSYAVIFVDEEKPERFIGREEDAEYSVDASSASAIGLGFCLLPYLKWWIVLPLVFVAYLVFIVIYSNLAGPWPE